MNKYVKEVLAINYHRNGIAGNGFYLIDFILQDDGFYNNVNLRAIYAPQHELEDGVDWANCFVIDPASVESCWRVDNFSEEIHKICVDYMYKRFGKPGEPIPEPNIVAGIEPVTL
jgi:hypothetical protein